MRLGARLPARWHLQHMARGLQEGWEAAGSWGSPMCMWVANSSAACQARSALFPVRATSSSLLRTSLLRTSLPCAACMLGASTSNLDRLPSIRADSRMILQLQTRRIFHMAPCLQLPVASAHTTKHACRFGSMEHAVGNAGSLRSCLHVSFFLGMLYLTAG